MNDSVWETFDALFKTARNQGKRIEELENRITELERRLREQNSNVVEFPLRDEREVVEV
jgi:hypothetical protein